MVRSGLACLVVLAALARPAGAETLEANGLRLVSLGTFDQPMFVTGPPGDPSRVFVVERAGAIRVVRDGTSSLFLTVPDVATAGEQGLLSMAFAPDYATSGRFYVYYADASAGACTGDMCDIRVDEFTRLTEDAADPASRRKVFDIAHRVTALHYGGTIAFGPDGRLYAATGDGGPQGDTDCDAQDPSSRLGKVLRTDPTESGAAPEVFALGLRNPFRFSFDRLTGDLLVGDVGWDEQEEIDFLPAGTPAGANLGWPAYEGTATRDTPCTVPASPVAPVLTYDHPDPDGPASVTGGVVVRDTSVPALLGRYVFADFYAGQLQSTVIGAGGATAPNAGGLQVDNPSAFGEDARCRLHVTSLAGPVYRLEAVDPAGVPACQTPPGPTAGGPAPDAGQGAAPATAAPAAAPAAAPRDRTRPVVRAGAMNPRRFAPARASTALFARRRGRPRVPRGSTLRYRLSEHATVALLVYRALPGRRARRRCVPGSRRLRSAPRCTRHAYRGFVVRVGVRAGRRLIRFSGRLRGRALVPGRYRMGIYAVDAAGNSAIPRAVGFTIAAG